MLIALPSMLICISIIYNTLFDILIHPFFVRPVFFRTKKMDL
jgi:hypothetical protein